MKLENGKASGLKKAIRVLAIFLGLSLAMTTNGAALQVSAWSQPRLKAPEFDKSEFAKTTVRWVLVSIPDRKLALFENGKLVRIYRVAVGKRSTPSPVGEFKIVNRVSNPTYYHKGKVIAAGKGNPVGTRWMGLSAKGYGIHGTNQPNSIGHAASTGCIRMRKQDLEELFALVDVGDEVQIQEGRNEQIAAVFGPGDADGAESARLAQADVESSSGGGQ